MRHRFHSLCPYFAMFPETFVEKWVRKLVPRDAVVLDPFCGRGTAPFQALLMGRRAIGCDVNPVAYCITRAKTNAPLASTVRRRLSALEKTYNPRLFTHEAAELPEYFSYAFDRRALAQLLFLRRELHWQTSNTDCMIAALVLGSLHGEADKSQAYFSNQMPRTISPKPGYSVKFWKERNLTPPKREVFELLRTRIAFRYESEVPERTAEVYCSDMRRLPELIDENTPIRYVITSPPYFDITNFEEDQWLRLWFLGNDPTPTYGKISQDDRHSSPVRYWEMICDLWRTLGQILDSRAHVIMRIGAKNQTPRQLSDCLLATSGFSGRNVRAADEFEVSAIKGRQTDAFRPGSQGCLVEVDFHFQMA